MATTKLKNDTKTTEEAPTAPESKSAVTGGIAADDLEVLEGDIDSRMDALLKDHQDMGARPK